MMYRWFPKVAVALTAFALLGAPNLASAETQAEIVQRLKASKDSERYEVTVPGEKVKAGGGRILVHAPLPIVRAIVQDYANYEKFMPRFKRSRIVGKSAKFTDVYFKVPILKGAASLWSVVHFGPPIRKRNGTEIIRGRKIRAQSNVADFRATWFLTPIDANTTLLRSEILIVPAVRVPASLITGELKYAADMAVTSTRNRAHSQLAAGRKKK